MKYTKTKCAICQTYENSRTLLEANLVESALNVETFSARRIPDRNFFRWVKCNECGLLRSDPVIELNLDKLYEESSFDYSTESDVLSKTYMRLLKKVKNRFNYSSVLEIGGGNGFFLDAVLRTGIKNVCGIEPSIEAIDSSSDQVKPKMIKGMLSRNIVKNLKFDVVTIFHVLDHLPDPLDSLQICREALNPRGTVLIAVHNCESVSARILNSKSPIFDVEHTYLYSKSSLKALLHAAGYEDVRVKAYWNTYSLAYLVHLLPVSRSFRVLIKNSALNALLSKVKVRVPLGNIYALATRSDSNTF
jgi:2-polyprenyl-3-methyl-5-hydroxy-6-metoxy-1,4-benzoquinol methylase